MTGGLSRQSSVSFKLPSKREYRENGPLRPWKLGSSDVTNILLYFFRLVNATVVFLQALMYFFPQAMLDLSWQNVASVSGHPRTQEGLRHGKTHRGIHIPAV